MEKDILYYDDACPICSAGMVKLAEHHDDGLGLLPITSLPMENQAAFSSELHLKTKDGQWVKRLEANVRANVETLTLDRSSQRSLYGAVSGLFGCCSCYLR